MGKLLKARELADKLNFNTETIYRMTKAGKIPHVVVGRSKRYDLAAVMQAMQSNTEETSK